MPDPARLTAIRERLKKITPPPWTAVDAAEGTGTCAWGVESVKRIVVLHDFVGQADAEFIAHAPDDLRDLLVLVDTLQQESRELRRQLEDQRGNAD